mgnify:FL=1
MISSVGIDETPTMTSSIIVAWTGSVCVSVGGRERAWDLIPDEIGWYRQGTKIQKVSDIVPYMYIIGKLRIWLWIFEYIHF